MQMSNFVTFFFTYSAPFIFTVGICYFKPLLKPLACSHRLRSFPGYLKWRSPILEKQTVESPYGTIVWQI
jgi:hypothetical protein